MPSSCTRTLTGRSPPARTSRICRRRGSATALNASAVVAARAMRESYSHIGICQAPRRTAVASLRVRGIRSLPCLLRRAIAMTEPLRVLIADDHAPTRAGVRVALEEAGCEVCAEVANAGDAVNDALRAGASGYLLKDMDPSGLAPALHAVAAGDAAIPGTLTARLVEELRHRGSSRTVSVGTRAGELTPREWEVGALLADGQSTAQMARRLCLSEVTVRRHMSRLMGKLGVTSRDELRRLIRRANRSRDGVG